MNACLTKKICLEINNRKKNYVKEFYFTRSAEDFIMKIFFRLTDGIKYLDFLSKGWK